MKCPDSLSKLGVTTHTGQYWVGVPSFYPMINAEGHFPAIWARLLKRVHDRNGVSDRTLNSSIKVISERSNDLSRRLVTSVQPLNDAVILKYYKK